MGVDRGTVRRAFEHSYPLRDDNGGLYLVKEIPHVTSDIVYVRAIGSFSFFYIPASMRLLNVASLEEAKTVFAYYGEARYNKVLNGDEVASTAVPLVYGTLSETEHAQGVSSQQTEEPLMTRRNYLTFTRAERESAAAITRKGAHWESATKEPVNSRKKFELKDAPRNYESYAFADMRRQALKTFVDNYNKDDVTLQYAPCRVWYETDGKGRPDVVSLSEVDNAINEVIWDNMDVILEKALERIDG